MAWKTVLVFFIAMSLALAGCGDDGGGGGDGPGQDADGTADAGADPAMTPDAGSTVADAGSQPTPPSLDGTWVGECIDGIDEDGDPESIIDTFTMLEDDATTGQMSFLSEIFADHDCVTPIFELRYTGTYVIGDPIDGLDDTWELDFILATATVTPLDMQVVDFLNANMQWGIDDWALGMASDVIGVDIFNMGSGPLAVGDVIYTIVKVDGDQLLTGEDAPDGSTPLAESDRATTLSPNAGTKQ